jgi:hypothetical protein
MKGRMDAAALDGVEERLEVLRELNVGGFLSEQEFADRKGQLLEQLCVQDASGDPSAREARLRATIGRVRALRSKGFVSDSDAEVCKVRQFSAKIVAHV